MTRAPHFLVVLFVLGVAACRPGAPTWTPLAAAPLATPDEVTLVWVGRGECERFDGGAWVRCPELDYEFSVEQHRRGTHWSSVKSLRRRHPSYDGVAGPRSLTYYFELDVAAPDAAGRVATELRSSLGHGRGTTDPEFRRAVLDIRADVSRFAPYDRYRISQHYDYEAGRLEELVELSDGDKPWIRNRETATLYRPLAFDGPPTRVSGP